MTDSVTTEAAIRPDAGNFAAMRHAMVASQLRGSAVNDPRVIDAMGTVPREPFVPVDQRAFAYADRLLPLPNGRALNLPMATGRLLTEARPLATDRALVIGAATGYSATLLAGLVANVVALEEDAALPAIATAPLPANVRVAEGPLANGVADGAPYDLILIDGAIEAVPQAIVDQLAENGRLATGLIDRGVTRLAIGRKAGAGFGTVAFADAETATLPGFARPPAFRF